MKPEASKIRVERSKQNDLQETKKLGLNTRKSEGSKRSRFLDPRALGPMAAKGGVRRL